LGLNPGGTSESWPPGVHAIGVFLSRGCYELD
jgi:hypothetical protein